MSTKLEFGCLPTAIGSMPNLDAQGACGLILKYLPAIPHWPQLPRRSFLENMYVQFSQGFPGVVIDGERIYVDRSSNLDPDLERLYAAYLAKDMEHYAISPDYAAGLYAFISSGVEASCLAVKGQVTGPISWGLTVTDQERRATIYDEILADAIAKHLRLKAAWEEQVLSQLSSNIVIFLDEPYMTSLGSAFVSIPSERVVQLLEEVLEGIKGVKGVHCCGNTDWSLLLGVSLDILSFDAYNYAQSLSLYPEEVKGFLGRGGTIAWGIVPNEETALAKESVASLRDRLEEAIAPFTRKGLPFRQLVEQSLLTPSCGLGSTSPEVAAQALELLADLSARLRKRYIT